MSRFLKSTLLNLAATCIGLAVTLVLLEIVLIWTIPPPLVFRHPQPIHRVDPRYGWTMVPNQHAFTIDKPVVLNSLGFRSPELSPEKDPRALRILCLGDSQTFGFGVAQDETYPARLEALLEREMDRPVEIINAGVQVYSTEQEVDQLEEYGPRFGIDVVTLAFYINDLEEVLIADKTSRMDDSTGRFTGATGIRRFVPQEALYFIRRSRLVIFVHWRLKLLTAGGDVNPETSVLLGTPPPKYERGWKIIEQALVRARSFTEAHGMRLIVFAIPHPQEFAQEYPNEQYRSRFLDLAHRLGIESIDPAPAIRAAGDDAQRFFITWNGHISSAANALIADLLARKIASATPTPIAPGREPIANQAEGVMAPSAAQNLPASTSFRNPMTPAM